MHSNHISPKQAQESQDGKGNGRRERYGAKKRRVGDPDDLNPLRSENGSSEDIQDKLVEHCTRPYMDEKRDPSEKYARRPRHKTKDDRYDYKDVPQKCSRKRHANRGGKKKTSAKLNEEFQAPNMSTDRLTLKPTAPGFLNKAKSSNNTEWMGLPDLTFSEMTFLKRKRKDDASRFQGTRKQEPKKNNRKAAGQEISDFFSKPAADSKGEVVPKPKPSSSQSFVSWSLSPPRTYISLAKRRLSCGAQSAEHEKEVLDDLQDLHVPASVRPNSSISNRFLTDFTTETLLRGVDEFARKQRKYCSLEDLKALAGKNFPDQNSNDKPPIDSTSVMGAEMEAIASQPVTECEPCGQAPFHRTALEPQHDYITTASYSSNAVGKVSRHLHYEQLPPNPGRGLEMVSYLEEHNNGQKQDALQFHNPPVPEDVEDQAHPGSELPQVIEQFDKGKPWLYDEEDLEFVQHHAEAEQPGFSQTEWLSTGGRPTKETALHETVAPFSGELDEFDLSLLRHDAEAFAQSKPAAMMDRDILTYEGGLEQPSRKICERRSQPTLEAQQDHITPCESARAQHPWEILMENHIVQRRFELSGSMNHVVHDRAGEFSGFSRGHILY